MGLRRAFLALTLSGALACAADELPAPPPAPAAPAPPPPAPAAPAPHPPARHAASLDGRDFPDRVIALTWDDGPDAHTLELAAYLRDRRVSATFFVVGDWSPDLSSDPGEGEAVFESGHARLPMLGDLVALGHRLGNHTAHHVLLGDADAATVRRELGDNQRRLDPFLANELRIFRAPGGSWSEEAGRAVDADPVLGSAIGPLRWDVDRKDWDASLACQSRRPAAECEAAAPGARARVKAGVIAKRYLAAIESAGRGVVLLHDRVGHVGSRYALEVAKRLVPELEARRFVFAPPVLRFSPLSPRGDAAHDLTTLFVADADGDGRGDVCGRTREAGEAITCLLARTETGGRLPRTTLRQRLHLARETPARPLDLDGDGIADRCAATATGVACARGRGAPERWTSWTSDFAGHPSLAFGDLNGDGRDDVCARTEGGLACALSTGRAFARATVWLAELTEARGYGGPLALGDINGDGRADVCARGPEGLACAVAP